MLFLFQWTDHQVYSYSHVKSLSGKVISETIFTNSKLLRWVISFGQNQTHGCYVMLVNLRLNHEWSLVPCDKILSFVSFLCEISEPFNISTYIQKEHQLHCNLFWNLVDNTCLRLRKYVNSTESMLENVLISGT